MGFLKSFGPQIQLVLVVLACAAFWFMGAPTYQTDASMKLNLDKIQAATNSSKTSPSYPFAPEITAEKLKYEVTLAANMERARKRPEAVVAANTVYQRPAPPKFEEKPSVPMTEETAAFGELSEAKASADHGVVYAACKLPDLMKFMAPVRLEIFRGESEKKIDLTTPYAVVDLGPEEVVQEDPAKKDTVAEKTEEDKPAATESAGERRRRQQAEAAAAKPKAGAGAAAAKEPKRAEDIPAEFATVRVFSDTRVEPKRTYYYQMRLIARMTVQPEKRTEIKDAATGVILKYHTIHGPKDAKTVQPSRPGAKTVLYTTAITAPVSASPPSNFEIRLSGTSGKLDPMGTPEYNKKKEYKGRFEVRVWITEAQIWHAMTIEAAPDERLKGTITYKDPSSKENKTFEFDSAYKLIEVKVVETTPDIIDKKMEVDENGQPVLDKNKKPIFKETTRKGQPIQNEVAILEELNLKRLEEFPKTGNFKIREAALGWYKRLSEEQNKISDIQKQVLERTKERVRAADEKQKAEKAERAAAATDTPPANIGGVGGGNSSGGKK